MGQIKREAKGIVKFERRFTGQVCTFGQACYFVVEQFQAAIKCLLETDFFVQQRFFDQALALHQFRVSRPHLLDEFWHQAVHHRVFVAQHMRVTHRAAHDAAQHVTAPVVGWHHAVRDQEGGGAQVVGDHAVARVHVAIGINGRRMRGSLDQRAHQIRVVVVVLALQQRTNAL